MATNASNSPEWNLVSHKAGETIKYELKCPHDQHFTFEETITFKVPDEGFSCAILISREITCPHGDKYMIENKTFNRAYILNAESGIKNS
jgi:hypothetical protein